MTKVTEELISLYAERYIESGVRRSTALMYCRVSLTLMVLNGDSLEWIKEEAVRKPWR